MKKELIRLVFISLLNSVILNQKLLSQDGAALFKPCAVCHSVGGGRLVGPDLKGITGRRTNEWLVQFIQSPTKMIGAGNPDAIAVFEEFNHSPMPDNNLSREQIDMILAFIDGPSKLENTVTDPVEAASKHKIDSILKANSRHDILLGLYLFNGKERFGNGGASCASCHNVTFDNVGKGGLLAKDLTKSFSRLGGFAGIKGILASPPYPSMQGAYRDQAITDEEIAYIQLFLKAADAQNPKDVVTRKAWFFHAALAGSVLLAIAISILWFKRKRISVNHAILKRQERYSK